MFLTIEMEQLFEILILDLFIIGYYRPKSKLFNTTHVDYQSEIVLFLFLVQSAVRLDSYVYNAVFLSTLNGESVEKKKVLEK